MTATQAAKMIYGERINTLNGEPGGGKTWVALHTCAEAIGSGHHVLFVDLEDHPGSTVSRLLGLGATAADIQGRFHYVKPTQPMGAEAMEYLEAAIGRHQVRLVVIDSIGELMALQGVKPNDDDAVARMYRAILRRLAQASPRPAVLLLDHVPKNNEHSPLYGIGSQRKKAAVDGAMFMVETIKAFSSDTPGRIVLRTAKDRNGWFTAGHVAAEVDVVPGGDGVALRLDIAAPQLGSQGRRRQTVNMQKVSDYLAAQTGMQQSRAKLEDGCGVGKRYIGDVLGDLMNEGFVEKVEEGPGKPVWYRLLRRFDEHESGVRGAFSAAPDDVF